MIDPYLLEELVVFAEKGTLQATAETLMITQPSVTRGLKNLEDQLGVQLFNRKPQRILLNETGQLAVQEAKKVLESHKNFTKTIHQFSNSKADLKIGSTLPGPFYLLNKIKKDIPQNLRVNQQVLLYDSEIVKQLEQYEYDLIISHEEILTEHIESIYLGTEKLSVNLDPFTYEANISNLYFKNLANMSFVVISEIGYWKNIIQNAQIENVKFLYQEDLDALREITNYANFPYFTTNLSHGQNTQNSRIHIPLSDASAQLDIYASYRSSEKQSFLKVIQTIQNSWPK